jgi:ABC-type glycerol-3-phosphate transport system substrate-binding protein
MLQWIGVSGAGALMAACAPTAPAAPAAEQAAAPAAGDAAAAPPDSAATQLAIWFHWSGQTGIFAQELIDMYNGEQGAADGIQVTIETVPGEEYRQKMTAVRLAGTQPDVYHTAIPIMELVTNEVAVELPDDEQAYVRDNYIEAAAERMSFEGKYWGYPTEHQAPALIYRRSVLEQAGITELPADTVGVRELAKELTREEGGVKYYGFTQWYDNYPANFHFPGIIWRHGGEMVEFEGDVPVKIMVDTPECIAALGWWRGMVDDGSTQVGEMPFTDAWQNGLAIMGEIEPWFPFINLRDAGVEDIYEDLGVVHVRPASGIDPVVQSGGWELVGDRSSQHPEEQIKFMQWMMHKPDMPFSHFIVERIGALPAPTEYPTPIPGWSDAMTEGYATQTAPITRMTPMIKVLGSGEIDVAISETVEAVMLKQKEVEPALQELQVQVDEILQRTDGSRMS